MASDASLTRERASRWRLLFVLVSLVPILLACGKKRLDASHESPSPRWDAPTAANGFRAVEPVPLCPDPPPPIATTQVGTLTRVAMVPGDERVTSIGADASFVYWMTLRDDGLGTIWRGSHPDARGPWTAEALVVGETWPSQLVVADPYLYWIRARPNVGTELRFLEKASGRVGTIELMTDRPQRLVAHGAQVHWLEGPRTLHTLERDAPSRSVLAPEALREPALAVDDDATYGFTSSKLLRIPKSGAEPTVLATVTDAVADLVVEGGWLYWLEHTPATGCANGGALGHRYRPQRPSLGSLRRVPRAGGRVEDVAVDLPNVETLTILRGKAYVMTRGGLLSLAPTATRGASAGASALGTTTALHVASARAARGRPATVGDALVLITDGPAPAVSLLAPP